MIAGTGDTGKSSPENGWRLPAKSLEQQPAAAVQAHLRDRAPINLLVDPSADVIRRIRHLLDRAASGRSTQSPDAFVSCIARAAIAPGKIELALDREAVTSCLAIEPALINADTLSFSIPFKFRKRGVETRPVIGNDQNRAVDETLIRSIAKGQQCYDAIRQGRTFEEIAASEKLSRRRILQVIDLAFLAPDIFKSIMQGDQPICLTAKWLGQYPLPSDWQAQRRIVTTV